MTTTAKFKSRELPGLPASTAIGSLPHHNVDAALAFAFQLDIPFLPQIPIRNPWEYMIPQALEGIPGLLVDADGLTALDLDVWLGRAHAFNERLLKAFGSAERPEAFESFEPSAAASSSWQPFLWELEERGAKFAKLQLAGPLTAQWSLRLKDGSRMDRQPELATQIYRLVLARALGMCRRLQAGGIQPILYLDEPGLYGLALANPLHAMAFQELKLLVQALRKESVLVGIHCCSNTEWPALLGMELNFLSIDTALSLGALLAHGERLENFVTGGGRLSLGVIPTSRVAGALQSFDVRETFAGLMDAFGRRLGGKPELVRRILREAIYTPACGLALHSTGDAEVVLASLIEFQKFCARSLT